MKYTCFFFELAQAQAQEENHETQKNKKVFQNKKMQKLKKIKIKNLRKSK